MDNKINYDIIYKSFPQGEEWVIASFMFWDEAMEYMEGKKKVLLENFYKRLSIR